MKLNLIKAYIIVRYGKLILIKAMKTMNEVTKKEEENVLIETQNNCLEKYQTPVVEVIEVELEGTILNTSDYKANRF